MMAWCSGIAPFGLAFAMIRWSDNAAADYLLARVGGPAVVLASAHRVGMASQQPVAPILGRLRRLGNPRPAVALSHAGGAGSARRGSGPGRRRSEVAVPAPRWTRSAS